MTGLIETKRTRSCCQGAPKSMQREHRTFTKLANSQPGRETTSSARGPRPPPRNRGRLARTWSTRRDSEARASAFAICALSSSSAAASCCSRCRQATPAAHGTLHLCIEHRSRNNASFTQTQPWRQEQLRWRRLMLSASHNRMTRSVPQVSVRNPMSLQKVTKRSCGEESTEAR